MCEKCSKVDESIANTPVIFGAGSYPSTLELAYMVNLEYKLEMKYDCIHEIPEDAKAKIKVKEMVDFLDERNWEQLGKTNSYGFRCSSFINHPSKQLVIVHRGTENLKQVKVDIMLALGAVTPEVIKMANWHTYQSLMNGALKEENRKFVRNDFSVTITGHSLGGWLAQICTLLSKYPKFHPVGPRDTIFFDNGKSIDMNQPYDLHCVAFDSPGASTVLNHLETISKTSALLAGSEREVDEALETLDINVYLSNGNMVNKCGTHVGKVESKPVMSKTNFVERWLIPLASHRMENILIYFKDNPSH